METFHEARITGIAEKGIHLYQHDGAFFEIGIKFDAQDFVEAILKAAQEKLDRKYHVQSRGYNFERLVKRVAKLFEISPKELLSGGKHTKTVKARSVVCYWGNRELGMSTIELSKKMNISQPTASQSVVRGQKIAREEKLAFLE